MNKYIYISVFFVLLTVLVIVIILNRRSFTTQIPFPYKVNPSPNIVGQKEISKSKVSIIPSPTIELKKSKKRLNLDGVLVKNFIQTDNFDRNGKISVIENNDYFIDYIPKSNGFYIESKGKKLSDFRNDAEMTLLKTLDIDKDSACYLNVVFAIDPSFDPANANVFYRLSFCK
ncbi:MAG: hypothetical protein Q7S61_01085 [bacterium]|nr:hypothetical protein [bacterium]